MPLSNICLTRLVSSGIAESHFVGISHDKCVSLEIQSVPLYLSFFTPNFVSVTKYMKSNTGTEDKFIYSFNISNSGRIDRALTKDEYYVFRSIGASSMTLSMSDFKTHGCTEIYIEDSPKTNHTFQITKNQDFFSTNFDMIKCYLYASKYHQNINGVLGECTNCPSIHLYEGPYHKMELKPSTSFSHTQQVEKYPITIVLRPPQKKDTQSDLEYFYMNLTSEMSIYNDTKYKSATYYGCINQTTHVYKNVYVGNIISYVFSSILLLSSIIILLITFSRYQNLCCFYFCPCHRGYESTSGVNTMYLFTSGKNYEKYMNNFDHITV
ncbi:hypothetical protein TVAG_046590 [Trichomonas vaginalis G3]|uniref:Uncharacterized protein n=1 Tax=Trichomonas vaginalis (strain ATCC PRA-98 / G3) TaxID=412133 RepID=A2EAN4_TRIV3|nr:hypothetical protein TVAGG3_0958310 [Trichomonas vaginalis G3]EAY10237.1 hypothetical protein TVAG_046590 [Trichomonas vaginalis G3]KAI5487719.1 hypothetical protein TVAGG3_0958310 [Trichomonas vaginalis G3]|eukprot:XP_001322460.1 hypothetical protein [Trichomonas vaginalis G3]